jgi:uncharacterized RDD family membrane protein YckC
VEFEDRVTLATPEGLDVALVAAGIGSRAAACLFDTFCQTLLVIALLVVQAAFDEAAVAVATNVGLFVTIVGWFLLFEAFGSGKTPGKRLAGLRVVAADGGAAGFFACLVRNVVRLVDMLPGTYLVGMIAVYASARNQRLGDLAAGTLVVRDRSARRPGGEMAWAEVAAEPVPALPPETASWDVSAVTPEEVGAVRSFLDRRGQLEPGVRAGLALELARRLHPKVSGIPEQHGPEVFLEWIVTLKDLRGS